MDENKEPKVVIEDESEGYSDLLEKFENPTQIKQTKKKNTGFKALIISLFTALAAVIAVICLLLFLPQNEKKADLTKSPQIKTEVGENNQLELEIKKDSDGKIEEKGSGALVEKYPADIKKIHLENKKGTLVINSYTPTTKTKETDPTTGEKVEKTEATQYTIEGMKDLQLQDGVADEIANVCSTLTFNSIADSDASSHLSDFGMDKPRAVATVTYTDNTTAKFIVGSNTPQNLGTYVMFGSGKEVFLCETDRAEKLLFGLADLTSLTINKSATDGNNTAFTELHLTNGNLSGEITLKPNSDTAHVANQYILNGSEFADDTNASAIAGAVRGLLAESVEAVNPTSKQLSELGLSSPFAHITAKFNDLSVNLYASKPDSTGKCHLMKNGGNIVYNIAMSSIPWVTTDLEKLTDEYLLNVKLSGLKNMSVTANSKTYSFDIKTTVTKTTDDDGEETESSSTATSINGKQLDEGNFEIFFNNAALLKKEGASGSTNGKAALTIAYTYDKTRSADTFRFFPNGNSYKVTHNGKLCGSVYKTYVDKLITQAPKVAEDKTVKTFW